MLPDLKTGTGLHLYIDQDKVRFVDHDKEIAAVPASAITEISYRTGTAESARPSGWPWSASGLAP